MADIRYVGVLNITPDSFSDGGRYTAADTATEQAATLFRSGASLVDIGAESTNPRSTPLTADQEIARLKPILPSLVKEFGSDTFSLDTYHPETLAWALGQGMEPVLNDISGLHHPVMRQLALEHNLTIIVSHLPKGADGVPTRAHTGEQIDHITQVTAELLETATVLETAGIPHEHIILDPGIGFGKTMRLNWQLLDFPAQVPGYDVMLGYSRKRFLHTDESGRGSPEAIAMKGAAKDSPEASRAYEQWLEKQHRHILAHIREANTTSSQTIYVRLHRVLP